MYRQAIKTTKRTNRIIAKEISKLKKSKTFNQDDANTIIKLESFIKKNKEFIYFMESKYKKFFTPRMIASWILILFPSLTMLLLRILGVNISVGWILSPFILVVLIGLMYIIHQTINK
jgi:hypothetical protein